MSSVAAVDMKKSKVEFFNAYYKVYDDAVDLIENNFGADKDIAETHRGYINGMSQAVMRSVNSAGTYITVANSIFPVTQQEYAERRTAQENAVGLCFDLLTKYRLIMHKLHIEDDKYTEQIKHISHEIKSLKNWKKSDNKRFKNLG